MTTGIGTRLAIAALRQRQIDHTPLLIQAGLRETDLTDPYGCVPCASEGRLIEAAAEATGDRAFGLRLSIRRNPRETHIGSFLFGVAPSLRTTIGLLPRYMRTVNQSQQWSVTHPDENSFALELRYLEISRRDLKHTAEFHVAECLRYLRDVAGYDLSPAHASFAHARTTEIGMFERFFRCPVEFAAESDRVMFSTNLLGVSSLRADPGRTPQPFKDEAATVRRVPGQSFRDGLAAELLHRLPRGAPTAEIVAKTLALTPRTFARVAHAG